MSTRRRPSGARARSGCTQSLARPPQRWRGLRALSRTLATRARGSRRSP